MYRVALGVLMALVAFAGCQRPGSAQSIEYAVDLYSHGLVADANRELLGLLHSEGSSAEVRAEALYHLGSIAFEEERYSTALEDWTELVRDHPDSDFAEEVAGRLEQFSAILGESLDETLGSAVARSYLRNGDFWFDDRVLSIDASWIPQADMAVEWYDRIISDYPTDVIAERAHQRKIGALLGWTEPGQYGSSFGAEEDSGTYMPLAVDAFTAYETSFPESSGLQRARYQIAQAFWKEKDWTQTREWLNSILEAGDRVDTFYSQLARARLRKVEY